MTTAIEVDPHDPKAVKVGDVHWRLWESKGGTHYATRAGDVTAEQVDLGYARTLDAETREELEIKLLSQPDVPQGEG